MVTFHTSLTKICHSRFPGFELTQPYLVAVLLLLLVLTHSSRSPYATRTFLRGSALAQVSTRAWEAQFIVLLMDPEDYSSLLLQLFN